MIRVLILSLLLLPTLALSATQIKLGVLVPEGTNWGLTLKNLAKDVAAATNNDVSMKFYFGGVSGDEIDVIRKMRVGQLQGGIFTGKSLGDINGDVRALEIPFTFYDKQEKATKALQKITPQLTKILEGKGYVNLGFYDLGKVYVVSTKKIATLNDLKGIKIWSWEGDPLIGAMLGSLGLVQVPLALPDVLSSLSTGIIDAAYAPPLAMIALQWHSKIKYLVDFPVAMSVGALLIDNKTWAKIKPEHKSKVLSLAQKYVADANQKFLLENEQAREQMKKMGVQFISFPAADYKQAAAARVQVIDKIKNTYISAGMIQLLDNEAK